LVACAAFGCALGPANAPLTATYDLGIERNTQRSAPIPAHIVLDDVSASPWLHTAAIVYRLTYQDAAQINPYSRSRWVAAPPVLVAQRLQLALARAVDGTPAGNAKSDARVLTLRIAIDTFEQLIDSPQSARGVVRMRVTLFNGVDRRPHAQRVIAMERVSETVDAEGAVRAISAATDASIAELLAWLGREGAGER
jgi:cholesterol transport system auxiliary component